ncbi:hypothetical protein ACFOSC_13835 [Streptantibioticus rubrisoli]|uniref:Uncharacterized protein n=1 Tax=Streptantibioticus rubrisoli TaxID=1387313 RepID=A0ABT1PCB1_9ACTN|nr:hypothetical protein [Streptantibioticus rubrisoli]MCQ4042996.1 hypothetical protein [Streptantibioticus rubrisoli]
MISYPDSSEVLSDLGPKVTQGLVAAVDQAAKDLQEYRAVHPSWVSQSSERGLANWIHDRLWAHLTAELDGHPGVTLTDGEPTRELIVGVSYRLRVKRHREDGQVRSYATQTALEFFAQGTQETFPGLEEVRLTAGYEWDPDARKIGEAVLSLRDGQENVVWLVPLRGVGEGAVDGNVQPVRPAAPQPPMPSIEVPATGKRQVTEGKAK